MKIIVKLFADLRINDKKELLLDMPEGSTPRDIIEQLDISERSIALMVVNDRIKDLDTILYEGDVVSMFPHVGGG